MFSKILEDSSSLFMMEREVIFRMNSHIVHVDFEPFFCDHVSTDMIHEGLEGGVT